MGILQSIAQPISRLKVLFYHLIWTARSKGAFAAVHYLIRRLHLGRSERRPGCPSRATTPRELHEFNAALAHLGGRPLFSLVIPAGEEPQGLRATLDSIQAQLYPPHQTLLLVNAADQSAGWLADLRGHYPLEVLAAQSGDLLEAVTGDYFCLVFPGDVLAADALGRVAIAASAAQGTALIYADEQYAQPGGLHGRALLKPDWSPDFLLSTDYIARAVFFARGAAARVGGVSLPCNRASLYNLALKVSEPVDAAPRHLPRILLTRAVDAGEGHETGGMQEALQAALQRRGLIGRATPLESQPGLFVAHIRPPEDHLTSILIATHDQPELLHRCLESIFRITRNSPFEVLLVDHESRLLATRQVIDHWRENEPTRFRCLPYAGEFNFSRINNFAASQAKGNLLLLLNNDTEVVTPDWLEELAGYACRPASGAVGAALEYPNGRIQHGGILLGMDDLAVHAFKDLPTQAPGYMGRLLVPSNFLAVTGACLMVRAGVYQALGGLSEEYSVAGGDIDFCLRIAQKGMYNIVLPHVRLIHHESATRGFENSYSKFSRLQKELDLLRQRWPEFVTHDPYYHPCLDGQGKFSTRS